MKSTRTSLSRRIRKKCKDSNNLRKECRDCIDYVMKPGINDKIEEVLRFVNMLLNIISGNSIAINKVCSLDEVRIQLIYIRRY